MHKLIIFALLSAVAVPSVAQDRDDRVSPRERAAVLKSLRSAGCSNPTEIERDDGGYEVDNARCKNGIFDMKLARDFRIIGREREDDHRRGVAHRDDDRHDDDRHND